VGVRTAGRGEFIDNQQVNEDPLTPVCDTLILSPLEEEEGRFLTMNRWLKGIMDNFGFEWRKERETEREKEVSLTINK
jgi:hypothetical protein